MERIQDRPLQPAALTKVDWYRDGTAGFIVTIGNYDDVGIAEISTGQGTELLFNATWGNYSTGENIP